MENIFNRPFFSIIIPVYNVEEYLPCCIDSVLAQKDVSLEIILVDDGSTDGCPAICDQYVMLDLRIHVIHKPNGGLSSARNAGLDIANGEYILFLDSDDYYDDPQGLTVLAQTCRKTQADYVGLNYKKLSLKTDLFSTDYLPIDSAILEKLSGRDVPRYFSSIQYFPGSAWAAALRKSFLDQWKLRFTPGLKSEDLDWLMYIYSYAEKYAYSEQNFYVYRLARSNSITNMLDRKSLTDVIFIIEKWQKRLSDKIYDHNRRYLNDYLAYHYLSTLILYHYVKKDCRAGLKEKIEADKGMLHHLVRRKVKIAAWIYKLLGFEVGSRILFYYHKRKY